MLLSFGARTMARISKKRFDRWYAHAVDLQQKVFKELISQGKQTAFGREHQLDKVVDHAGFARQVPIRDYEGLRPWIDRILKGEEHVLWPGRPMYLSKTSGTTSGAKYIPITKDSMPNHLNSTRQALLMYVLKTGKTDFLKGRMIFVSGSPELDTSGDIPTGRLSGIAHRHIPAYLRRRRLPSYEVNCIEDWEEKLSAIVKESADKNMSLISGIPPWVEMYFERLLTATGKATIGELYPGFSLFVYGGVNFQPYEKKFRALIGKEVDSLETFPASEGFVGFQDEWPSEGLLLVPDAGVFYEFIPADRFYEEDPPRLTLGEVEPGVNYAMIMNTNAGLWGYSIGDTIRFVSVNPYRFVSTGRLSHFTSAFGEHVIVQEAEESMTRAMTEAGAMVREFTLAPLVDNPGGKPCHQWFVEFSKEPGDMEHFVQVLDQTLQEKNPYYKDLVSGGILQPAKVEHVPSGTFHNYMKAVGKLGGQNKVPHLANDRRIADWITENVLSG
ncbi:MAG: GH3 auxin-responsive promoter family protein [Bacteroidales bacterium]